MLVRAPLPPRPSASATPPAAPPRGRNVAQGRDGRRLFTALGVAVALLLAYNLAIAVTSHTTQRRRMLAMVEHPPANATCVFLGNSLTEAGIDPAAFTAALPATARDLVPLNLGLGATTPVEHALIWRKALESPTFRPRFLVYGFFDDQLNAFVRGDWPDLVGNRAFSYYFPRRAAAFYAPNSALVPWELRATAAVPMLADRSSLWTKVEHLRRAFEAVGMPPVKVTRFGRVADFAALEDSEIASFNRRCAAIVDGHLGFSAPVADIFRRAREHGIRVILLEMPMPSKHREAFYASPVWTRLRAHLRHLAAAEGITYLSAADWVRADGEFEDAMHLSPAGAKDFSGQLAKVFAGMDEK